jgi:uncharacterized protein
MPTRSLNSSVLKWPDRETVVGALKKWVYVQASSKSELLRAGYFGSYAKGNWGVGSDVDILLILDQSDKPFIERGVSWDVRGLPVPAELILYTKKEWDAMEERSEPFFQQLSKEVVWIYQRETEKGEN